MDFEIDKPGKDSYKIRKAGADLMLIGSQKRWALMVERKEDNQTKRLQEYVSYLNRSTLDIILVEGFKPEIIPKIELHRVGLGHPLICETDESVIALATDVDIDVRPDMTLLDLNDHRAIAEFNCQKILCQIFSVVKQEKYKTGEIMKQSDIEKEISCMDDFDPGSLSPEQALEKIFDGVAPVTETELLPIRDALNRVSASNIHSPVNVPAGRNSAMDGYAIRAKDLPEKGTATLELIGSAFAGAPFQGKLENGKCVRIMTGALIPAGRRYCDYSGARQGRWQTYSH